jgi:hypothetical protein
MPDYSDIIEKHANRAGVDPTWMKRIMRIESGGDAGNKTGSYKGLFQLSDSEFRRHGGTGDIYDPEQNTMAAANKLAQEKLTFKQKYNRDPNLVDMYMIHQQGEAGYAAHMNNPNSPAWENMLSTGEGQAKGAKWAKAAIWGNMSAADKEKYGSVENVSSAEFMGDWSNKIAGTTASGSGFVSAKGRTQTLRHGAKELEGEEEDKSLVNLPSVATGIRVPEFDVPQLVPQIRLAGGAQ